VNIKASRELYLQPNEFAFATLASDKEVHPTVLGGYPDIVLVPKLPVDIVPDEKLTLMDREYWLHLVSFLRDTVKPKRAKRPPYQAMG
jgi:hypothetical protein